MPHEYDYEPSDELLELIFAALDSAVSSVKPDGELSPFVMTEGEGDRRLVRFVGDDLGVCMEEANAYLASKCGPDVTRYVLVTSGFVSLDEEDEPAVFAESGERLAECGALFCQRYAPGEEGDECDTVGDAAYIDQPKLRFKD